MLDLDQTGAPAPSRRHLLKLSAAAAGGLVIGFRIPGAQAKDATPDAGARDAEGAFEFAPNAFLRIDREGRVSILMPQIEMGQGTHTSLPMLLAEELEVPLERVTVLEAPPDDKLYANPLIGFQVTGGSTSVRAFWTPLRTAGAAARVMLTEAAAARWGVDPSSVRASAGEAIHAETGRRLPYGDLVEAAARRPVPEKPPLKDPKDFTLIGKPAARLDTPQKVNGAAKFGIDVRLPGMAYAAVSACPVFGGTLKSVDESKAKAVKGVRQIVRMDDAVAVVADHYGAARKGLEALVVEWDAGPNAHFGQKDLVAQMSEAAAKGEAVPGEKVGDVDVAMKSAARKIEAVYELPFLAHAAMEPINVTIDARPDACEIFVGTQVISRAQEAAAKALGLPPEKVKVHNHLIGGAFGRRLDVDSIVQAANLAKQVKGPLKIVWSREEDVQHDVYRPYYYDRLAAGLDKDGRAVAFSHRVVGSSIVARWAPPLFKNGLDFDAVEGAAGPYAFDNLLVDYVRHEPPAGMTTGWWRGVGSTHNAFMVEGFVDELAAAAGADPVDYRRALLGKSPRALAVLNLAAEKSGWGSPLPKGEGRGVSVIFAFGSYLAQVAEVAVAPDGSVRVKRVVSAFDCGRKVNPDTLRAQVEGGLLFGVAAALYGEITLADGRVEQSNFNDYPVLRINEAPLMETYLVESEEAPGGAGEPGTAGIAPAVVNAVFAATGKRLRKLPIDAQALKSA
ncbi:molybdopterin cofactor-binding domain-containing protein [Methylocella sp.]|uniref:xanthine dehydrogenase family protein molybdopterin-binding subunit n=1 Tax=Methylocella sp. TaxID=1978226 RepID=UPI0037835E35